VLNLYYRLLQKFDESIKAANGTKEIEISKRWGIFANEGLKQLFHEETIFKYSPFQETCKIH